MKQRLFGTEFSESFGVIVASRFPKSAGFAFQERSGVKESGEDGLVHFLRILKLG